MSGEEVLRFLEAFECIAESTGKGKLFFYLAFFQLCTGARIGEACAIHWNDVDLITGHLNISKNVKWGRGKDSETSIKPFTKTGVGRRIPMTKDLRYLLSKMKQSPSGKLVFSEDGNEPLSYRSVQHYYARAFKAAGISWKGSHVLRHTFSTNYLTATKDYVSLSRFLGHASTRQTEHYAKITGTLTDRSFETFNESAGEMFGNVLAFDQSAG